MDIIPPILLIVFAGLLGSYSSMKSFGGGSMVWPILSGQVTVLAWSFMTKQRFSPVMAAILFDGLYCTSWYVGVMLHGTKINGTQAVGIMLVMSGMMVAGFGSR